MSYKSEDMRLMGGVPGQQMFLYRSTDSAADVKTAGYFNAACEEYNMDSGDIIIACTGAETCAAIDLVVANCSNANVAVTPVA